MMITEISTQHENQPNATKRKRGFTLTEIAIVLGIIGLILGAIWGAASSVYSNKHIADAEQGITATAQAVRSLYATSSGGFAAAGSILVPGMLPTSWVNANGSYSNPFAVTTVAANSWTYVTSGGAGSTIFGVELDGVSGAGCAALLNYFGFNATSLNGGQITGLVGTQGSFATNPNVAGTKTVAAAPAGTGVAGSFTGAVNCVTTTSNATAAGTTATGINAVQVDFNMANM
jgi:prepilin-type N-terminal cleavage/methylation domain-containing protein